MATKKKAKAKKKKKNPKKVVRAYKGSDAYLEQQSIIIHDLLVNDKTELIVVDPGLDDPYASDFDAAITLAVGEIRANVIRAQMKSKTGVVIDAMQGCRDKYEEVILFAGKAFPKDKAKLQEFGQGSAYQKARNSQKEMFSFMTQLSKTANRLKVDLIAKDYTQLRIDDILAKRDALLTSNTTQNDFIVMRPELTAKRIGEYNAVYARVTQVIKAAKLAFKNDAAKLGEYIYNPPIQHRHNIILEIDLAGGETKNADVSNVHGTPSTTIEIETSDEEIQLYASATNNGIPGPATPHLNVDTIKNYKAAGAAFIALLGLSDATPFLMVTNRGTGATHCKLTFRKVAE